MISIQSGFPVHCRAVCTVIVHNSKGNCWKSMLKSSPCWVESLGVKELYICKIFVFLLSGVKLFPSQGMKNLGVFMDLSPSLMIISAELPGWHLIISEQCSAALPPLPNGCWIAYPCLLQCPGWINQLSLECFQQREFTGNSWSKSSPSRTLAQPLYTVFVLGCVVLTAWEQKAAASFAVHGLMQSFFISKNKGLNWLRVTNKVSSVALTSSLADICLQYKPTTWVHHDGQSFFMWDPGNGYLGVLKATAGVN